jgi:hypothetical protein
MNKVVIMKEVNSPALKEVVNQLVDVVDQVGSNAMPYQQGSCLITGCKHVVQALALDWAFNKKIQPIKNLESRKGK